MLNEVAQSFVVGAARTPVLTQPITLGDQRYQLPAEQTAPECLLTQASIAALTALALTPAARPKLNYAPPFPSESIIGVKEINHRAAYLLKRMLSGSNLELVPEALMAIGQRQQRIPLDLLPTLLNALDSTDKRTWLAPVQCAAIRWLARQNPAWAWAVVSTEQDPLIAFEQETGAARHNAFAILRRHNADEARTLLADVFPRENAEERAALLKQCLHGLSLADEGFLEGALDDRSKTVRQIAADLLARLPESGFIRRTLDHTLPLVSIERGLIRKTLQVTLPDEPGKTDERDGIDPRATPDGLNHVGPRQLHLAQRVSYVPPVQWKKHLDLDFPDIVAQFIKHEFSLPLCVGFCIAAVRLKDTEALRALMVLSKKKRLIYIHYVEKNLPLLSDITDIVATQIKKTGQLDMGLLSALPTPWRDDITQAVLAWAKGMDYAKDITDHNTHYHFAAVLRLAATGIAADEKFLRDWPTTDRDTANLSQQQIAKAIDQFHKTLQTRIKFFSALEKP